MIDRRYDMKIPGYIIVGDTDKYDDCLICVCSNRKSAESTLNRMLTNPTENDKRLMNGYRNLRVEEVPENECWWRNA